MDCICDVEAVFSLEDSNVGISDHNELTGKEKPNQHPISAITGLQEVLDGLENDESELGDQVQGLQGDVNTIKQQIPNLATKEELSNIDLSAYANKSYVDEAISKVESQDLSDLTNYIDNKISTNVTGGIRADYAIKYGILDCPNGLIDYSPNNKQIEIQPSIVIQAAGSETKTILASKTVYEVEETGKITLFFTKTESSSGTTQVGFLEAGDVYYQEEEPSDGITSFLAWWQPSKGKWQFKSNLTGNVWREAIATPIANINAGSVGITSINYIGYRIIDDDVFAQLSDIENLQNTIQNLLTRIEALENK